MILYCIIYMKWCNYIIYYDSILYHMMWYDVESCIVILFQICIMKWYNCKIRNDIVCINWYMVRYMIKHHIIIPFLFISYDNIVSNCNTISYQMIHCPIIWYNILSWYIIVLYHNTILWSIIRYEIVHITRYNIVSYDMIRYCVIPYNTIF